MSGFVQNPGSFAAKPEWQVTSRAATHAENVEGASADDLGPRPGYSGVQEHVSTFHSFLEYSTLILFPFLFLPNFYLSFTSLYEQELVWLILLAIPVSLLGGDLISGVVHWAADTYCSEDTPIVGPGFVKPFRLHHIYPRDITTHHLAATVGNVCVMAVPVLLVCLYLMWRDEVSAWVAFPVFCLSLMALVTAATNQFHKWAHQEIPPPHARLLQRLRLVLEPEHHELHHTDPFESHYCITNGWLNPLLNKIKFFRRLEGALARVGIHTAKYYENQRSAARGVSS
ncbi:MAG TPA: fatty acid desaturase CarF family protein [Pyrinomonadaceae bacterium]|nr:fatty acid desaturase CarF family protein [Pyrinomonadaceae bacterium]